MTDTIAPPHLHFWGFEVTWKDTTFFSEFILWRDDQGSFYPLQGHVQFFSTQFKNPTHFRVHNWVNQDFASFTIEIISVGVVSLLPVIDASPLLMGRLLSTWGPGYLMQEVVSSIYDMEVVVIKSQVYAWQKIIDLQNENVNWDANPDDEILQEPTTKWGVERGKISFLKVPASWEVVCSEVVILKHIYMWATLNRNWAFINMCMYAKKKQLKKRSWIWKRMRGWGKRWTGCGGVERM